MDLQRRDFLLVVTLAAAAVTPAFGASGGAHGWASR